MQKKWKKTTHKIWAYLLAVSMVLALMPTTIFAEDEAAYTTEYELENVEEIENVEDVEEIEDVEDVEDVEEIEDVTVEGSAKDGTMSLVNQAVWSSPATEIISTFSVKATIGTDESNPFYIGTEAVLAELADLVADGEKYGSYSYADAYYVMVDDIELSGEWTPIGLDSSSPFAGTFDGDGYEISGLYINSASSQQGLFGYNTGTIQKVGVSGSVTGSYYVGGVVGYNLGTVQYCYNTGSVLGSEGFVGGVVGYNKNLVQYCYNTGNVTGGSIYTGGVVGCNYDSSATISHCVSLGASVSGEIYESITNVGRVSGKKGASSNNYAWDGITVTVSGVITTVSNNTTTGIDGADLTYDSGAGELTGVASWIAVFGSASGWSGDMSKLPNGDDLPDYITDTSWDGVSLTAFASGIGSEEDPYIIKTGAQLAYLASNVSEYDEDTYFELGADIDLNDKDWSPIGTSSNKFLGTFDGNGYEISGLYINSESSYQGLFGYSTGTIQNVTVSGEVTVSGSFYYTGGVVGYNTGTVKSCVNYATVTGNSNVGGVIGCNTGAVESCVNYATVTASKTIGGVVGDNNGGTVESCINTASVFGSGNTVGGVVGNNSVSMGETALVSNCYNTGSVTSNSYYVGGVVGYNATVHSGSYATVSSCYNTGSVTSDSYYVGGVVGYNSNMASNTASISNCVSLGNHVSGTNNVGRVVGINDGTTTLTNNYAWSGMTVNGTATTAVGTNGTIAETDGGNGADLIYSEDVLYGTDAYGAVVSIWSTIFGTLPTDWQNNMSKLPNGDALPSYITEATEDTTGFTEITTAEELAKIGIDADYPLSGNYILMNDIDLGGSDSEQWEALGSSSDPFTGTFDGDGYEISGLYINSSESYQGLFGYSTGTIKNLTVSGEVTVSGTLVNSIGGVVGYNYGGTVENCINNASVSGVGHIGGIVGSNKSENADTAASVSNCYNTGTITGNDSNGSCVGGVVGYSYTSGGTVNVTNCYNTGAVSGKNYNVGGVVGGNGAGTSANSKASVTSCYNTGAVSCDGKQVGGVVGNNSGSSDDTATISDCYNTGAVSGTNYVGGVVGRNVAGYGAASIYNCYNVGAVSGTGDYVGGVAGGNVANYSGNSDNSVASIYSCYNTGTIKSSGDYVGGIVGVNETAASGGDIVDILGSDVATVSTCYNTGTIKGSDGYVGGIAGANLVNCTGGTATIENCVSLANSITGMDDIGRVVGVSEVLEGYIGVAVYLSNNYAWSGMTGDFDTTTDGIGTTTINGADLYFTSTSGFYTNSTLTTAFDWENGAMFNGVWTLPETTYELPTLLGETSQNPLANLEFCTVDFVYFGDVHVPQSVEIGSTLTKPTDVTEVAGYSYDWMYTYEDTDGDLVNEVFDFTTTITEDLTLTLVCTLKAPVITVSDLTKVYEKNNSAIIATATHDVSNPTFEYAWYKEVMYTVNGDGDDTIITEWQKVSETNEFTVQYVADSGTYKVVVAVTDANGSTSTAEQTITVSITNATMTDNTTKTQTAAYTGSALTPSVASATTVDGTTAVVKYQDTDGEYTLTEMPSFIENGTYKVYYEITAANHTTIEDKIEFIIAKSDTTFDDDNETPVSTLKAYNGTTETTSFTYGDTITVKVTPRATGVATTSSYTEQSTNSVALYIGTTQITEPKTVTTGEELTFLIDTTNQELAINGNEITAKYVGDGNMASYSDSITVTLAKKALTATVATDTNETSITKVYDGNADFADVALVLSGVVTVDTTADDVSATAQGTRASANVNGTATFTASEVTLDGDDAKYYSLETTDVTGTVAITIKDLDSSDIVMADITNQAYTGFEIKPEPAVTYGELSLTANTDFIYSYGNNIAVAEATDEANPPTVTITAVANGNYSGNTSRTFAIVKKAEQTLGNIELSQRYTVTIEQTQSLAGLMPEDAGALVYTVGEAITDGTEITPVFSVDGDGLVTYSLGDVSSSDVGGVVYLPITISSTNYEDSTVTLAITIVNKTSSTSSYYIKVTATGGGTIDPDGGADSMYKVSKYDDVTFAFDADSGYEVADVIVNGVSVGVCDEYTFENIIATTQSLEVVFEKKSSSSSSSDDEDDEDEEMEAEETIELPFVDVDEDDDNYNGIAYVYEAGIMAGISGDVFGSDLSITRGMIAAILYRIQGSEPVDGDMLFEDVSEDQYYLEAVRWGKAAGVMAGVSATEFAPNTAITMEQFMAFLYRYASYLEMDMYVEYAYDLSGYEISNYAMTAIAWALENDIIELDDLYPTAEALRGDVATALMNFMEMM